MKGVFYKIRKVDKDMKFTQIETVIWASSVMEKSMEKAVFIGIQ